MTVTRDYTNPEVREAMAGLTETFRRIDLKLKRIPVLAKCPSQQTEETNGTR